MLAMNLATPRVTGQPTSSLTTIASMLAPTGDERFFELLVFKSIQRHEIKTSTALPTITALAS
ncbi:hypothetical protein [Pseudomonas vancouverensis]|uniref:hypothetical protein n=1 Tax=Pseudomonas vancouverensis TaxID=95300 RepID=UPI0012FDA54A|nr:hypothetical protein [Pseudomonas vancouverensis]